MISRNSFYQFFLAFISAGWWQQPLQSMSSLSNTITATLTGQPPFYQPTVIAITPNGDYAYVANHYSEDTTGFIDIFNVPANTYISPITNVNLPSSFAFTPDGTYLYFTSFEHNTVNAIQLSDNTITATINLALGARPSSLAITTNGEYAYVANSNTNTVNAIQLSDNTITATIDLALGAGHSSLAITPNGEYAYVANFNTNTVNAIQLSDNTITATIDLALGAGPSSLAITPNGEYAYVANFNTNTVNAIQLSDNTITATIDLESLAFSNSIAITPNGEYAYVANEGTNTVNVIQLSDNTITATINLALGADPFSLAITPNGEYAYVANFSNNTVNQIFIEEPITAPEQLTVCKGKNVFLNQTDYINVIYWQAPTTGTPVTYKIYRDAALTQLVATLSATTLSYADHNRIPGFTYTYYIVAIDGLGNVSSSAAVTALVAC